MTGLLVSVRDAAEARTALAAGVDLLDLKEPSRGALGPVDGNVVDEVVALAAAHAPISAALGELQDLPVDKIPSLAVSRALRYVKTGLSRCAADPAWPRRLAALSALLPTSTALVAVIYADAARVGAPGVDEVLEAAHLAKCGAVLVDTAVKDGRTLIDHWSPTLLRRFVIDVRSRGLTCVVGGGLTLEAIPKAAACEPDYVAVRGAACIGGRTGTVDAGRITALRAALRR